MTGQNPAESADPELYRLLATLPPLAMRPVSAWQVTPLAGLTNRSWRVTSGALDLVLRVPGPSSQRYLSRVQEQHNTRIAAELGIAPSLLYADSDSGVTVQAYLSGAEPLGQADFGDPAVARAVGVNLGRLHGSARDFHGHMAPFPIIDLYLSLAADERLRRLRRAAEPIREALERDVPRLVPSHIDPNPANFLRLPDGTLRLIDWEFSAMCEPAWDIAAVTLEGAEGEAAQAALLEGYGSTAARPDPARLRLMQAALHLVAGSWTYAEIAGGNAAPGLPALLERCLSNAERMLDDPELGRWLGAQRA